MPELQPPPLNPTYHRVRASQLRMKNRAKKDRSFISRSENVVKSASERIVKTYNAVSNAVGERPFNQHKLSERQQLRRYSVVRNNPDGWQALIKEHGLAAAIDYALRMEKLAKKFPEEANYVTPELEQAS